MDDTVLSSYPPLLRGLLVSRGITTDAGAAAFLEPNYERDTHDPFLLADMERAVGRIQNAIEAGERIAIWSDYDMDGIPGAVVLWDTFHKIGYTNVVHHTPHRNNDGFGLNVHGLEQLAAEGVTLVITIDCGITDTEQVAFARTQGLDVIITDHHLPHGELPNAYAIVNPKRDDCAYPEPMLCGAAVAWKLACALLARSSVDVHTGWEKWLLDMVGMSTIADMVPLTGENRALAYYGLQVLRKSKRPGLHALLRKARAKQATLTEDDIGFTIGPRINAASRMGHAKDAFALLASDNPGEASAMSDVLEKINNERKGVVAAMVREAKARLEARDSIPEVIVLGSVEWMPSLLGLVAGSLTDTYKRPAFLWGGNGGSTLKGSCRSDGVAHVVELMQAAAAHLEEFGGHAYSGGFVVRRESLHEFEAALVAAKKANGEHTNNPSVYIDAILTPDEVTDAMYREITRLAPFGEGNPKPLFLFKNVATEPRAFGKSGEHLELALPRTTGAPLKAIAFFTHAEDYALDLTRDRCDIVATLEKSTFKWPHEVRLRIVSLHKTIPLVT